MFIFGHVVRTERVERGKHPEFSLIVIAKKYGGFDRIVGMQSKCIEDRGELSKLIENRHVVSRDIFWHGNCCDIRNRRAIQRRDALQFLKVNRVLGLYILRKELEFGRCIRAQPRWWIRLGFRLMPRLRD